MNIQTGYGNQVKVTCIDGMVVEGLYSIYTQAQDNVPEKASITLETDDGLVEIYEDEIRNIETLS